MNQQFDHGFQPLESTDLSGHREIFEHVKPDVISLTDDPGIRIVELVTEESGHKLVTQLYMFGDLIRNSVPK